MEASNLDIGVIGLNRIYDGQPKKVDIIDPNNLNLTVNYYDDNGTKLTEYPVEEGTYSVIVKNNDISIKKKLVIKNDSQDYISNFLNSDNNKILNIDEESSYEELTESDDFSENIKIKDDLSKILISDNNNSNRIIKKKLKKKKIKKIKNNSIISDIINQPHIIAGLGLSAYIGYKYFYNK